MELDVVQPHHRPVSRRSLAKGVAWSVPAVWASSALPAFAASGGCQYTAQFISSPTNAVTSLLATSPTTSRTILIELRQATGPCTTVTAAPQDAGLGDATLLNPFRRSAGDKKSESAFQWMDTFSFTRLQRNSLTLTYSNGYYGYQFISIAALSFVGPC